MNLLYVEIARSLWMFDLRLFNPKGLGIQGTFEKLAEKYRFAKFPKHVLDLNDQKALAFQHGTFLNSANIPIGISFTIYNNGVTAETSSCTDDATEFLLEVASWMSEEYGFVIPSGKDLGKGYFSQVGVEFDAPLSGMNATLPTIAKSLSSRVKTLDGNTRQFDVGALNFWTEDIGQPLAPAAFRLERKWKTSFARNEYFSQAPLETAEHIDVLKQLEAALKTRS